MGEAVPSKDIDNKLVFAVNGQKFELSTVDPSTTLLEFLRTQTKFKGVKLGCGEGGCGACIVLLSKYNPVLKQVEDFTVSSCLTLLCSISECSITTTEGLGSSKNGFHPIHQRISGFHASQCGFCTPGMCISLYSAIVNAEKTDRPEPRPGFSKLSVSEAEKSVAGNLCRCTGYRPIIDVCKSAASDVDMEDLGINSFWRKGKPEELKASKLPPFNREHVTCKFPEFLDKKKRLCLPDAWHSPASTEDLLKILEHADDIGSRTKLVVGNTGTGYYKEAVPYDKFIDLRFVPELSMVKRDDTGIELGATVTISRVIEELKEKTPECPLEDVMVFEKIANHMEKIASVFIRNSASIGGNLIMAQRSYFPSDIATILIAVGSLVDLASGSKRETITLEEFLRRPPFDAKGVLLRVKIPTSSPIRSTSKTRNRMLFKTYRAAPRPLGNALPYLNAAFSAEVSPSEITECVMIKKCCLVFGAFGTKHAIRAGKAEEFLIGKILNADVLHTAIKLVKASIVPGDGTSSPAYRSSVAASFLFQFFSPLIDGDTGHPLQGYNSVLDDSINNHNPNYSKTPFLLSSAKQVVESSKEYNPVGEPISKTAAALQASGEAVYVDDLPSPQDCLHGAFICSTNSLGRINDIKFKQELPPDLVTAVLSYKDIPKGGENIGSMAMFGTSPLFAEDVVQFAGQRLALVVAETQKKADMAANFAVVAYDMEDLEPPILTVQEAVKKSSFFEVPSFCNPKQVGDFSRGMAEADHRILAAEIKLGSQYYFYMETQTALAIPDEDNCMLVYSSSQCPEYAHRVIAKCLGVPDNNVRVITRRVGGGFGGKAIKAMPVATACALAAHKLNRPVRMFLNRKTDMITAGGRHPMEVTYSVGFKSSGKITALNLDILINAGYSADISPVLPSNILGTLKKYDWGALSFDIKVCKTNHTSKSAMRAPGEVQGSFIAEAIIEHVASTLSMEVGLVRERNLHSFKSLNIFYEGSAGQPLEYTLPSIWDKMASSSCYNQRAEKIKELNGCNKWHKRGISRVPIVHEVLVRATPGKVSILNDGSIVVEVGGIELGQGLWTKVKQMTAFALGAIKCDGAEDLLKKVRVIQSDTLSLIQGGFTAGSTTSESSCEAVRLCCNILVERLNPLLENLRQQIGSVKWETLISQANVLAVNLSASSYFVPVFSDMKYLNYGAAVSEVEINILTGETTILRSDIIYDCGQSLNPAVDFGQIEGAFVQGIGFFMLEEYLTNSEGLVTAEGTWTYKIPTIDTIPKEFNVEILNSGHHQKRVLSSKASGEPPLLLAVSVHCATRAAIKEARTQLVAWNGKLDGDASTFQLPVPATMPVVKELCGLDIVEQYLEYVSSLTSKKASSLI